MLIDRRLCPSCHGTGSSPVTTTAGVPVCLACAGNGWLPLALPEPPATLALRTREAMLGDCRGVEIDASYEGLYPRDGRMAADVRALLDECDRLTAENARLRGLVKPADGGGGK